MIPTEKKALETWLDQLTGKIALAGCGVAFLDAQITDLEKKCLLALDHAKTRLTKPIQNA